MPWLISGSLRPLRLVLGTFSIVFRRFRHRFHLFSSLSPSNSSRRLQAKTKNPRALRPGGPPPKTVPAIDQSHILRPDVRRRSRIPWKILERSAPGEHPQKQLLQSINHIYFVPTYFDDRESPGKSSSAPPRGNTPKSSFYNRSITYTSYRRTSTIDNPWHGGGFARSASGYIYIGIYIYI